MKQIIVLSLALTILVFSLPVLAGSGFLLSEPTATLDVSASLNSPAATMSAPLPSASPSPGVSAPAAVPMAEAGDETLMVKVLVEDTVREMSMRDYLFGVLAAEMPATFPVEALRAQAVAARTYTEYKMQLAKGPNGPDERHKGADVCSDYHHCKAYLSRAEAMTGWAEHAEEYAAIVEGAVRDTDSLVILYEDEPIVAVFFAMSGGHTENAKDVWGADIPYLQNVESPGESAEQGFETTREIAAAEFKRLFADAYPNANLDGDSSTWIGEPVRSAAGGVISIPVGGVQIPGTKLRELCQLRSTNFTVTWQGDTVIFRTIGYGHGVGMSQSGAKAMALAGKNFEEILNWYYTGVAVLPYHPEVTQPSPDQPSPAPPSDETGDVET